ncbi:ABC transporter substrate-binding protein [Bifidobacterium longum]|uniref:Extracellular solute-binding protein n=2 Tax=Bifidobacterium longum subsp. infantis TaxID=1682 RepID=A0A7Y5ALA7_BIFLI|nr:ABC transporter substrate-binding protein [Bifidobacterium longum]NQX51508.1 extracellular solute-binding protein [Bifidobacterium longum subsp. infantis]
MRRRTALKAGAITCAVALLGSLAACGGSKEPTTTADGKPIVSVLVVKRPATDKIANMQWAKDLEADCDCKIEWQEVSEDAWAQQKNATLAAGKIADVSLHAFFPANAAQFPGLFEDLSKDLDKMPNVKQFFKEKPDAQKLTTDPEGHMYALPSSRGKSYSGTGQHMFINKTWLDKLGLQVPTTWDELENVLKAFKTQDPNGNGQADEIPMNIKKLESSYYTWYSPMLLLNSTGISTGFNMSAASETGFYAKNGVVKSFMTSDEYKQVIKYYHKLISEGLIPADWATKTFDACDTDQLSDGKTAKTGVSFGWSQDASFGTLKDQYIPIPVPSAPGVSPDKTVWDGSSSEFDAAGPAVSARAANKDATLKLLNLMYSEKYSVQQFYGSFGKTVTKTGEHEYTVDNDKLIEMRKKNTSPSLSYPAGWIPDEVTIKGDAGSDALYQASKVYEKQRSNFDPVKDYIPDYVNPDADDNTTLASNYNQISNVAMQKTATWMSKGGIDEEWDAYCKQLDSLGLQENVKIWQKWYDIYTKK